MLPHYKQNVALTNLCRRSRPTENFRRAKIRMTLQPIIPTALPRVAALVAARRHQKWQRSCPCSRKRRRQSRSGVLPSTTDRTDRCQLLGWTVVRVLALVWFLVMLWLGLHDHSLRDRVPAAGAVVTALREQELSRSIRCWRSSFELQVGRLLAIWQLQSLHHSHRDAQCLCILFTGTTPRRMLGRQRMCRRQIQCREVIPV
mmetsp:Transcript_107/g.216  ORF Transcript_107/g.216 Transcript_107/m.216 type:complete len:202 (+) Transcript_107:715-1320(+)